MRIKFKCFFVLTLFIVFFNENKAQIVVDDSFNHSLFGKKMECYRDSTFLLELKDIVSIQEDFKKVEEDIFSEAFNDVAYWFKIKVKNTSKNELFIIECQNPDVNHIEVFQVNDSGKLFSSFTNAGDYYPFNDRPKKYVNFAFPFFAPKGSEMTYYIRTYFHGEPVTLPLYLWNFNKFYENANDKSFLFGGYFFILFTVTIFMFVTWLIGKSKMNLYYSLFVLSLSLFLIARVGYSYQYFYPNYPFLRNLDQPIFAGFLFYFFLLFSMQYLQLKQQLPLWYKLFRWLSIFIVIQILSVPLFMHDILPMEPFQFSYLVTLILSSIAVLMVSLYLSIKIKNKRFYIFFIAYLFELIGFIYHFFNVFDIIDITLFGRYFMYYAVLLELIIFSIYLTYQLIAIRRDNLYMSLELNKQKQQALVGIMLGEQSERKRLSHELHDGLGLMLSTIKARLSNITINDQIESEKLNHIITEVDHACNDIRIMSHNLSPYKIEEEGLKSVLESLFYQLNSTYNIQFKLNYNLKEQDKLPSILESNIYRGIQELVQNIIKHSLANKASLIIEKDNEEFYYIQMKDNGVGFNPADKKNWGIGLANVKRRVKYFGGTFEINSKPNRGTLITVKFKLHDDPLL